MFVVGTAGHVDHGKSTLIKALTGIDPDRLKEEKDRQMTIDLGFAWLELPSGMEVGIVDVPGHRDFIDNMLAGAGGIDAVLFVIAADEGIMPQSKEHLSILNLLKIPYGIIVLTKIDMAPDPEWLALIKADIEKFVAGTFLENSPIMEVSAKFGTGLKELVASLDTLLRKSSPKRDINRPRLPIDRVFSLKGFGTVVTGTTLDGQFTLGEQVEILPQRIPTRIRGIQSHKKKLEVAAPGSRTALNLTGVRVDEIERGNIIARSGTFVSTRRIDVQFSLLKDAQKAVAHNDLVKFYSGSSQTQARVRVIGSERILPGEKGWLQLELEDNVTIAKGDHYILRKPSPGETLGGGLVLDENPQKRSKRFSKKTIDRFNLLENGTPKSLIMNMLGSGQAQPVQVLSEKTGLPLEITINIVKVLLNSDIALFNKRNEEITPDLIVMSRKSWLDVAEKIIKIISKYHDDFPLRQGMQKNELRRVLSESPRIFAVYIEHLIKEKKLIEIGDYVLLPGHSSDFSDSDNEIVKNMLAAFKQTPYSPPAMADLENQFGAEILHAAISKGILVQTSEDIAFRKQDFETMLSGLKAHISHEGRIALNQFRDMFKTSRKFALSFLEYLDKKGITTREGDSRILRAIDKE